MRVRTLLAVLAIAGVACSRPARQIDGRFFGFNVVNLQSGNFSTDEAYSAATADVLHAKVLRYPGGNLADFWNWTTGWCVNTTEAVGCAKCSNPCQRKNKHPRIYKLEEFAIAVKRAAARTVILLNMLTDTLPSQLKFLAEAQRLGVLPAASYVELGGEFYFGKYSERWPMASDYGNHSRYPHSFAVLITEHYLLHQLPRPTFGRRRSKGGSQR